MEDEDDPLPNAVLARLGLDRTFVPRLWHYEVRNALLIAERRGRLPPGGAAERLDGLADLDVVTDGDADLPAAFALAVAHGLTFYDALYLELAARRGAALATLDARLARAAAAEGIGAPSA